MYDLEFQDAYRIVNGLIDRCPFYLILNKNTEEKYLIIQPIIYLDSRIYLINYNEDFKYKNFTICDLNEHKDYLRRKLVELKLILKNEITGVVKIIRPQEIYSKFENGSYWNEDHESNFEMIRNYNR